LSYGHHGRRIDAGGRPIIRASRRDSTGSDVSADLG